MKIHKVLNNNFVIIKSEDGREQIVGGKGIAFGKRSGDQLDSNAINKTFVIPDSKGLDGIKKYLEVIDVEYFQIAINIVEYAKFKTGKTINESICLAIADHLNSSVTRMKNGTPIPNYMLWELKKFYTAEFEVGMYGLKLIEEELEIKLSEDEAGFIATHIIDSELEQSNIEQVYKTTKLIKGISNIVKYYFNVNFDTESIYYYRFITHLKFFANRLFNDYMLTNDDDTALYDMIQKSYVNSFGCVEKIEQHLLNDYSYSLSKEEKIYLTIHIENVIYKSKK
ncbi:PRD domain-containing protein [Mollicutes bacterium LVI A0078]|nr:PRD domain-containing protein [Mollicutes bacterium LVI A0075]WOO91199.1 PRD domain-containing protein [Mollicutes bacterium LVI A0078]